MENILDKLNIENRELTEQELDVIYFYLNMEYDNFTEEEKQMWYRVLSLIDKDFFEDYENKDGRPE
jgi:succinate dehydrogenase flavin-adding protein (antitoxin of CptAB toxin-antitoxin module)